VEETENVRRIVDSEMTGTMEADTIKALVKVCGNAMKQYRRTRPEASRAGVRRAKALLEGERTETGERVGGDGLHPHPLLLNIEKEKSMNGKADKNIEDLKKRDDFLRAMSQFRPKETVFEAFGTGGSKDASIVSHIDKGRTVASSKKGDLTHSLQAMKNMRREMRLVRDRGSNLFVAGTMNDTALEPDPSSGNSEVGVDKTEPQANNVEDKPKSSIDRIMESGSGSTKRHLSKAERKRLKKNGKGNTTENCEQMGVADDKKAKNKRGEDFRDPSFFISNEIVTNSAEAARSRQIEAALQPSAASSRNGTVAAALRIEETMLDIVGDEKADLVKRQRFLRWDKSKRKYIQTTVGAELSGDSKSKRLRLESGQLVKNDKAKLGELYEKWQKKTNRSIGRVGIFDDALDVDTPVVSTGREKRTAQQGKKMKSEELKSSEQIKKEREKKMDNKLKNMKKEDRRKVERSQRQFRAFDTQKGMKKATGGRKR